MSRVFKALIVCQLLAAAGCSTLSQPPLARHLEATGETAVCARLYQAFSRVVAAAGVRDAQASPVAGFPYLRVNRFLASFRHDLTSRDGRVYRDWLATARQQGRVASRMELANLPDKPATWEVLGVAGRAAAGRRLESCADHLQWLDQTDPNTPALLQVQARVPDAYADYQRVIGLYPLTALLVAHGISELHASIRQTFERPVAGLPLAGELVDYVPPAAPDTANRAAGVRNWYADVVRDALGVPQLNAEQLEALFHRHAPIWRVDVAAAADRAGTPFWRDRDRIDVDIDRPRVYRKLSYTRWQGYTLVQLNYIIWFPARPKLGPLDILGGHLDGVTWRVTLGPEGEPLLYDAMHNCGCYHMAFPTDRLEPRNVGSPWNEPLSVPVTAPSLETDKHIRIWLAHRTHYLQRIDTVNPNSSAVEYSLGDYRELRSLITETGLRSLFDPTGLVPGSERLERWILWPMGVPEPGAMRQWGTHATAFVGKRHFDDPDLIARYFRPADE